AKFFSQCDCVAVELSCMAGSSGAIAPVRSGSETDTKSDVHQRQRSPCQMALEPRRQPLRREFVVDDIRQRGDRGGVAADGAALQARRCAAVLPIEQRLEEQRPENTAEMMDQKT